MGRVALLCVIYNDLFKAHKALQVLYPLDNCVRIDWGYLEEIGIDLRKNFIIYA